MPLSGILLSFDGILLRMKESNEKEECLMCQLQQLPHREGIHLQLKSVVSRDLARVFNSHIQISRSPLGYISCLTDYLSSLFWLRTLTANYCYVVQWNRGGGGCLGMILRAEPLDCACPEAETGGRIVDMAGILLVSLRWAGDGSKTILSFLIKMS